VTMVSAGSWRGAAPTCSSAWLAAARMPCPPAARACTRS
jgi:hypothetical protein